MERRSSNDAPLVVAHVASCYDETLQVLRTVTASETVVHALVDGTVTDSWSAPEAVQSVTCVGRSTFVTTSGGGWLVGSDDEPRRLARVPCYSPTAAGSEWIGWCEPKRAVVFSVLQQQVVFALDGAFTEIRVSRAAGNVALVDAARQKLVILPNALRSPSPLCPTAVSFSMLGRVVHIKWLGVDDDLLAVAYDGQDGRGSLMCYRCHIDNSGGGNYWDVSEAYTAVLSTPTIVDVVGSSERKDHLWILYWDHQTLTCAWLTGCRSSRVGKVQDRLVVSCVSRDLHHAHPERSDDSLRSEIHSIKVLRFFEPIRDAANPAKECHMLVQVRLSSGVVVAGMLNPNTGCFSEERALAAIVVERSGDALHGIHPLCVAFTGNFITVKLQSTIRSNLVFEATFRKVTSSRLRLVRVDARQCTTQPPSELKSCRGPASAAGQCVVEVRRTNTSGTCAAVYLRTGAVLQIPSGTVDESTATIICSCEYLGCVQAVLQSDNHAGAILLSWHLHAPEQTATLTALLPQSVGSLYAFTSSGQLVSVNRETGDVSRWLRGAEVKLCQVPFVGDIAGATATPDSVALLTSTRVILVDIPPVLKSVALAQQFFAAALRQEWSYVASFVARWHQSQGTVRQRIVTLVDETEQSGDASERAGVLVWTTTPCDEEHSSSKDENGVATSTARDEATPTVFGALDTSSDRGSSVPSTQTLEAIAELLLNNRLYGSSSIAQMELLAAVEALRLSHSFIVAVAEEAACAYILSTKLRHVSQKLKLLGEQRTHYSAVMWAALSDQQDAILQELNRVAEVTQGWDEFAQAHVPFWLRSVPQLKQLVDALAKSQYQKKRDVRDAALFYALVGRKQVLAALCKASNEQRLSDFFSRDFSVEKNRSAAVSNAYIAVGKGNIWFGAAFFVLAGDGRSAAHVVLDRLGDANLALLIVRLCYHDDASQIQWLLTELEASRNQQRTGALEPFLASLFDWRAGEHVAAMHSLSRIGDEWALTALQMMSFASRNVAVLTRRTSEFFTTEAQYRLAASAAAHALNTGDRLTAVKLRAFLQRLESAVKLSVELAAGSAAGGGGGTSASVANATRADFASGTLTMAFDDDDDDCGGSCGPSATLADCASALADNQRPVVTSDDTLLARIRSTLDCLLHPPRFTAHREAALEVAVLFPDLSQMVTAAATRDRRSEDLLDVLLRLLNECSVRQNAPKHVLTCAVMLALARHAVAATDVALSCCLVSTGAHWISHGGSHEGVPTDTLLADLASAKRQTLQRPARDEAGTDDPLVITANGTSAEKRREITPHLEVVIGAAKIVYHILRSVGHEELPHCWWTSNLLLHTAVFYCVHLEPFLVPMFGDYLQLRASKPPSVLDDGTALHLLQAKNLLWDSSPKGIIETIIPTELTQRLWTHVKQLLVANVVRAPPALGDGAAPDMSWLSLEPASVGTPATHELLAALQNDSEFFAALAAAWRSRQITKDACEAQHFANAVVQGTALSARSVIFTGNHGITSIALDQSSWDNVAIATHSSITIQHNLRDVLASATGIAHADAADDMAKRYAVAAMADVVNRNIKSSFRRLRAGATSSASLVAHPHAPFFLSLSSQDDARVVDLFSFGEAESLARCKIDSPVTAWSDPEMSLCGSYFSLGARTSGDVLTFCVEHAFSAPLNDGYVRRCKAFSGGCSALKHLSSSSLVVLATGSDIDHEGSTAKQAVGGGKFVVKLLDPAVCRNVIASSSAPHAASYLCEGTSSHSVWLLSEQGEMSLYDIRRNAVVLSQLLVLPSASDGKSKKKSSDCRISAVTTLDHHQLLVVGTSDGRCFLAPLQEASPESPDGELPLVHALSCATLTQAGSSARDVAVTSLRCAPSAILFGLGDGRAGAISLLESRTSSF